MKESVLITGAAGFIGYHLSRRLAGEGFSVTGLDNLNDYYEVSLKEARLRALGLEEIPGPGDGGAAESAKLPFRFLRGDIAKPEDVERAFLLARPEIVVNLAAQAGVRYSIENPAAYIQSNIVGFFNVLEACRHHPVAHLLYASSSSVYGNRKNTPFSVDDPVDKPVSLYAATKKSDELMAYTYSLLYGIPATGLRFFTVYGPFGRPDMAYFSFARKIFAGEAIKVFNHGDLYRDFTYVDDIVSGIRALLTAPPQKAGEEAASRVYNIGNNRPVKLTQFIDALEDCLGKKAIREYLPMQPGDVYSTCADIGPIERDFGFRPSTDIREGLTAFAAWYRAYYSPGV